MTLQEHVLKAIKDYKQGETDSALMHACIAIDATARNLYRGTKIGKKEYKDCIQNYIWIIEPMMGNGINLEETIWSNVEVDNGYGKIINNPDLADIIYHIFRCSHTHGKEVSKNYELLPMVDGKLAWQVGGGIIRMPILIIHALLAVSVFSKVNNGIKTSGNYYLPLGKEEFIIKDWWGKEDDFRSFLSKKIPNPTRVKIDGLKNFDPSSSSKGFNVQIIPPYWD